MVITCENCRTRFQLDEARLPARGARVRCSRCQHRFHIKPPPPALEPDEIASRVVEDTAAVAPAHSQQRQERDGDGSARAAPGAEADLVGRDPLAETDPLIRADVSPDGPMVESLPVAPPAGAKSEEEPDPDLENPEFLFDRPSSEAEDADLDDPDAEPPSMALLEGDSGPDEPGPELGMEPDALLGSPVPPEPDAEQVESDADLLFTETDDPDALFSDGAGDLEPDGTDPLPDVAPGPSSERESDSLAAETSAPPASAEAGPGEESAETDFSQPDLAPPDWSDLQEAFDDADDAGSGSRGGAVRGANRDASASPAESSTRGVERVASRPLHSLAAEPAAEPTSRWSAEVAMGAAAVALGLLLVASAGISLARFSPLAATGPGRVSSSGWTAQVADVFHRRAQNGARVLVVRGTLSGTGTRAAWLPSVRVQLVDARGRPQGPPVWAEPAWLAGSGLGPVSVSSVLSLAGVERPYPRPVPRDGSATRFTALLPHPPGSATRYRLEVIP